MPRLTFRDLTAEFRANAESDEHFAQCVAEACALIVDLAAATDRPAAAIRDVFELN